MRLIEYDEHMVFWIVEHKDRFYELDAPDPMSLKSHRQEWKLWIYPKSMTEQEVIEGDPYATPISVSNPKLLTTIKAFCRLVTP